MHDRRRYERVPFIRDAVLGRDEGIAPANVTVMDLSEGGVGLFVPNYIAQGARLTLLVHLPHPDNPERGEVVHGQVRFSKAEFEGTRIGMEFDELLTEVRNPLLWAELQAALLRSTRVD